jgi:hypothetical protein
MIYHCCDALRRDATAADPVLNGIDYVEVIDRELPETDPLRQRTLLLYCLKPLPATMSQDNVRLSGGERIRNLVVQWAAPASPTPAQLNAPTETATAAIIGDALNAVAAPGSVLIVRVSEPGDFSTYTLRLVLPAGDSPTDLFDPQLCAIDFSFKVECSSDFDCRPIHVCPPDAASAPDIDYFAKDYGSFRRLLLDRMSQLAPQWRESSAADFGIALVELLAYVGDQLSYEQDAVATEAYLATARRRISLRRHALLVDYLMHDGCNARAWVQLDVRQDGDFPLRGPQFLTRCPGLDPGIARSSMQHRNATLLSPIVFEPVLDERLAPNYLQPLHADHNRISFYTWGDTRCCLPRGATRATLAGPLPHLHAGDALLFEEVLGPQTGEPGDADIAHRHVVRLTSVSPIAPATLADPLTTTPVVEISWAREDALPFALCLSNTIADANGPKPVSDISVARGNLVLVDHGETIVDEALGEVPPPTLFLAPGDGSDFCAPVEPRPFPARYRPQLTRGPLTQAASTIALSPPGAISGRRIPFDFRAPAARAIDWSMADVFPQVRLTSALGAETDIWEPRRSLLKSSATATDFVAEIDDDGRAMLRFGDDTHGMRPDTGTTFAASYRIGNGSAGNVGADTIAHCVAAGADIAILSGVRNPLPAGGGVEPESAESVRRNAPQAFRTQERAVTSEDYAAVTERDARVQRAAATLRWTGSWHTVFITVDADAGIDTLALRTELAPHVDCYRMAGHDLEFNDPRFVSLELALHVCVKPDYFRSDVEQRLRELFSNSALPDGRRGLFHPDNFSFGETVYLSRLYAAAHDVPGVASVRIDTIQRQGTKDPTYLALGKLPLGRLEIARLANDANYPEHGVLRLDINGGK